MRWLKWLIGIVLVALAGLTAIALLLFWDIHRVQGRVIEIRPSPDGSRAAVLFLQGDHDFYTRYTLRVGIAEKANLPNVGDNFVADDGTVLALAAGGRNDAIDRARLLSAWPDDQTLAFCINFEDLIEFSAWGGRPQVTARLESCEGWVKRHPG